MAAAAATAADTDEREAAGRGGRGGMVLNYLGSKARLLPALHRVMGPHIGGRTVFADLFAGTGVVAARYRDVAARVVANDAEAYSALLCAAQLAPPPPDADALLAALARAAEDSATTASSAAADASATGVIARHFSPAGGDTGRTFFTPANAARIDGALTAVEAWTRAGRIGAAERAFLLASLMTSCVRRSNTNGTFVAPLKRWWPRALPAVRLRVIPTAPPPPNSAPSTGRQGRRHVARQGDAADAARELTAGGVDVVYLDPPFNGRQYGTYYRFLNLLAAPTAADRARLAAAPGAYSRSAWCSRRHAVGALRELSDALRGRARRRR